MSFVSKLFGAGEGIAKPIEAVGNTLDKLFTSDAERAQAAIVMEKLQQQPDILQAELNKLEAQNPNVFVSGWRPFIGWTCGLGLFFHFLISPIVEWITILFGMTVSAPKFDVSTLMTLVLSLLGLGGMRTYERFRGIARQK